MNDFAFNVENLSYYIKDGSNKKAIFEDTSFTIGSSSIVVLYGRSGIGKTTLLRLLCGIESADNGFISIAGQEISNMKPKNLAEMRRSTIGIIFQEFNLIERLTVYENLQLTVYENLQLPLIFNKVEKIKLKFKLNALLKKSV